MLLLVAILIRVIAAQIKVSDIFEQIPELDFQLQCIYDGGNLCFLNLDESQVSPPGYCVSLWFGQNFLFDFTDLTCTNDIPTYIARPVMIQNPCEIDANEQIWTQFNGSFQLSFNMTLTSNSVCRHVITDLYAQNFTDAEAQQIKNITFSQFDGAGAFLISQLLPGTPYNNSSQYMNAGNWMVQRLVADYEYFVRINYSQKFYIVIQGHGQMNFMIQNVEKEFFGPLLTTFEIPAPIPTAFIETPPIDKKIVAIVVSVVLIVIITILLIICYIFCASAAMIVGTAVCCCRCLKSKQKTVDVKISHRYSETEARMANVQTQEGENRQETGSFGERDEPQFEVVPVKNKILQKFDNFERKIFKSSLVEQQINQANNLIDYVQEQMKSKDENSFTYEKDNKKRDFRDLANVPECKEITQNIFAQNLNSDHSKKSDSDEGDSMKVYRKVFKVKKVQETIEQIETQRNFIEKPKIVQKEQDSLPAEIKSIKAENQIDIDSELQQIIKDNPNTFLSPQKDIKTQGQGQTVVLPGLLGTVVDCDLQDVLETPPQSSGKKKKKKKRIFQSGIQSEFEI